jgi:hypothetical protein
VGDRSQFWQNVDATKPDKLSRLSVRQLRDYQNYFLEVQGDYNPPLPQHENTVASERLILLRDEIGRRGKRRPGASVAERQHKQVIFWMKIGAALAVVAIGVTIVIALYHTSPSPAAPPTSKPNTPTAEPSAPHATSPPLESTPLTNATPSSVSTPIPFSPITFPEINRVESDPNRTGLHKDEFRRKHEGKIVEWTVTVRSVTRLWEHRPDSGFNVVFADAADTKGSRELGAANFPAKLRDDMVDLQQGDTIRFRGVLHFSGPIHCMVIVNDCQLLEHRTK